MPLFFLTLTANDHHWHGLLGTYNVQSFDAMRQEVRNDPFGAVSYFHVKLDAFLARYLQPRFGVTHLVAKIEFQGRGTTHAHLVGWSPLSEEIHTPAGFNVAAAIRIHDMIVSCWNDHIDRAVEVTVAEHCQKDPATITDVYDHGSLGAHLFCRHTRCGPHCQVTRHGVSRCRFHLPNHEMSNETQIVRDEDNRLVVKSKRNDPYMTHHNKEILGLWNGR